MVFGTALVCSWLYISGAKFLLNWRPVELASTDCWPIPANQHTSSQWCRHDVKSIVAVKQSFSLILQDCPQRPSKPISLIENLPNQYDKIPGGWEIYVVPLNIYLHITQSYKQRFMAGTKKKILKSQIEGAVKSYYLLFLRAWLIYWHGMVITICLII